MWQGTASPLELEPQVTISRSRRNRIRLSTSDVDKEKKSERNFLVSAIGASLIIWIVNTWWPGTLPFETFGQPFWDRDTSVTEAIGAVWFIFVWGIGINFVIQLGQNLNGDSGITRFLRRDREPSSGAILAGGTIISFLAGTLEELCFRWLLFLGGIVSVLIANWLWGGILGCILFGLIALALCAALFKANEFLGALGLVVSIVGGIILIANGGFMDPVAWLYDVLAKPLADLTTFGYLHEQIYHPHSWAVGAGLLSANAFFRDGHKYQGLFGVINAWFGGMIFFWVLFHYGLVACMVVHFLYDFAIYATVAFMRLFRH